MALWDLLKEIREKSGLTRTDFADSIGVTLVHVSALEKPHEKGSKTKRQASPELLRRVAKAYSTSEAERIELERRLLFELARLRVEPEIAELYLADEKLNEGAMPEKFTERLKTDLGNLQQKGSQSLLLPGDMLNGVLERKLSLTRRQVSELAVSLGQSVIQYLLLAGHVPYEVADIIDVEAFSKLFAFLEKQTHQDVEKLTLALDTALEIVLKDIRGKTSLQQEKQLG